MANEARHAAARGLKRVRGKKKRKRWDGKEDERASPCQMKHRTQLSPAAGLDHTSYVRTYVPHTYVPHLTCCFPSPAIHMHQVLLRASFAESDRKCLEILYFQKHCLLFFKIIFLFKNHSESRIYVYTRPANFQVTDCLIKKIEQSAGEG